MATAFRTGTLELIQHLYDSGTCTGLSDARLLELQFRQPAARRVRSPRWWARDGGDGGRTRARPRSRTRTPPMTHSRRRSCCCFARPGRFAREATHSGGWLHGVAYRTALQARSDAARRRDVEQAAGAVESPTDHVARRPPESVLHEEIESAAGRSFRLGRWSSATWKVNTRDQAADLHALVARVRCAVDWRKGASCSSCRPTRRGVHVRRPVRGPGRHSHKLGFGDCPRRHGRGVRNGRGTQNGCLAGVGFGLAQSRGGGPAGPRNGSSGVRLSRPLAVPPTPNPRSRPSPSSPSPWSPDLKNPPRPQPRPAYRRLRSRGEIVDLEGRPVAGATISVKYVLSPPEGKLDVWIDEVKRLAKQPFGLNTMADPSPHAPVLGDERSRWPVPDRGDAQRWYRHTAAISGPGIETSEVYILTRDVPTIIVSKKPDLAGAPMLIYYGRFDHVAAKGPSDYWHDPRQGHRRPRLPESTSPACPTSRAA